jgi:hypothetical protein
MVFGLIGLIIPLFIIGAIVYLVVRRRNNEGVTAYQALMAYFYTMISASIFTTAVGAGYLLKAAIRPAYNDWSIANEVTLGVTLLVTGAVICLLHVFGKKALERKEGKATPLLKRVYLFFMLSVFSIGGLVALPLAIYEIAHYYVENHSEEFMYWSDPSGTIAAAVVIVPLWIYYLMRVLRNTHAAKQEESSEEGVSTAI